MTVNQRVSGSSPEGGALKLKRLFLASFFFTLILQITDIVKYKLRRFM